MLQNSYERARYVTEATNIYVVTEAGHASHVFEQLPELPKENIIIEPGRRGTANCLIAGLERISHHDHNNEPIMLMHADHQILNTEAFVTTVLYAAKISQIEKKITLLGVVPTYPAALGYIHKGKALQGSGEEFAYEVKAFKEKPEFKLAQKYQESGEYLWNLGYFVAPLEVFLEKMEKNAPQMLANYNALREADGNEQKYNDTYLAFENLIIDYELMETTPDLLVVPGAFDWVDIGSFNDLAKVLPVDETGNHVRGQNIELAEVSNAYVRNDGSQTVAVIGLDNVVVINSPNGILVARKDLSQKVGDIAKKLQAQAEAK